MNQSTTIDAESMMRESANSAGGLFNRTLILAGENGALRQQVTELETANKALNQQLEVLREEVNANRAD